MSADLAAQVAQAVGLVGCKRLATDPNYRAFLERQPPQRLRPMLANTLALARRDFGSIEFDLCFDKRVKRRPVGAQQVVIASP